jgi:hypothetical protein
MSSFLNPYRFAAAAGAFVPTDISGCQLWFAASAITGLSDGDAVSTWSDASGNGNDATQSGAARPVYKTSIINGHPVVRFTAASSQFFNLTTALSLSPFTIAAVMKKSGTGKNLSPLASNTNYGGVPLNALFDDNFYMGEPAGYLVNYANAFTAWDYAVGTSAGSGVFAAWIGGAAVTFTASAYAGYSAFDRIGRWFNTYYSDGDIAEIILYDSVLGTTDRQALEAYFASKYAL